MRDKNTNVGTLAKSVGGTYAWGWEGVFAEHYGNSNTYTLYEKHKCKILDALNKRLAKSASQVCNNAD